MAARCEVYMQGGDCGCMWVHIQVWPRMFDDLGHQLFTFTDITYPFPHLFHIFPRHHVTLLNPSCCLTPLPLVSPCFPSTTTNRSCYFIFLPLFSKQSNALLFFWGASPYSLSRLGTRELSQFTLGGGVLGLNSSSWGVFFVDVGYVDLFFSRGRVAVRLRCCAGSPIQGWIHEGDMGESK